jgi:hypothetical protein
VDIFSSSFFPKRATIGDKDMKTVKLPRRQNQVVQKLTRKEVSTLMKYPKILIEAKPLLRAFKKVVKKVEGIPEHANRRKRATAYKRIAGICQKAIESIEQ